MFKTVVILVALMSSDGHIYDNGRKEYTMPSWEMCLQAVETAKVHSVQGKDGDPIVGQLFCATKQVPTDSDMVKAIDEFLADPNANPYRKK